MATHLRMLLESESYSQTTVKDMDFILNSFASYMDKNGLDVYSPEIGERLIQYCEVELKVCASRVSRARVIVRKLNRLNQRLDGREALWGDKTSPIVLPAGFEKILSAYISLQEEGKQTDYASLQAMDLQQILKESFKFWLRKSRGYQRRHGPVSVFTIKVFSVLGTDRPIPAVSL
ncbi:hypothetical protein [Parabacteroides goldsteinii]|uniref:hypothetical protein n=1 Tax=Parabacteroides goldsteinii TaxID=328812 RepID=UPI002AAB2D61|nr:hypothetical protein [Parabacteroides goldsteinii]